MQVLTNMRFSLRFVLGSALPALFCFSLIGCSGCGTGSTYQEDILYPLRTDAIVISLPPTAPEKLEPTGELDEGILRLEGRGGKLLKPENISEPVRVSLSQTLNQMFGKPAAPKVPESEMTNDLELDTESLKVGAQLFRSKCQHCHGMTGDGRGTSGPWTYPHPRDYRQGVFKFVTNQGSIPGRASRADLLRTIENGLTGTAMPSFAMLPEEQRQHLARYVTFLSLRGKVELELIKLILTEELTAEQIPAEANEIVTRELKNWQSANLKPVSTTVIEYPSGSPELFDSIRRGEKLFTDPKGPAGCVACHTNYGRESKLQYDVWGTIIKPANLTEVRRKGGLQLQAHYHRIKIGIPPVNMPVGTLTEGQISDLANFVRTLPYSKELPDDVRKKVYGE